MNRVSLTGRIHEIRELTKCTFITVICRTRSKNEFIDVVIFGTQKYFFKKHFRKGSWIGIDARLSKSIREMSDGTRRAQLSVIAENIEMVGPPPQTITEQTPTTYNNIEKKTYTQMDLQPLETVDPDKLPFDVVDSDDHPY